MIDMSGEGEVVVRKYNQAFKNCIYVCYNTLYPCPTSELQYRKLRY